METKAIKFVATWYVPFDANGFRYMTQRKLH